MLGCTHYPLLKPVLERVAGPGVTLIDSAEEVADTVAAGLAAAGLAHAASGAADLPGRHLCVTDAGETFQRIAGRILGDPAVPLEWVEVV